MRYLSERDVEASLPTMEEQLSIAEDALIALASDDAEVPPKIGVHPRIAGASSHATSRSSSMHHACRSSRSTRPRQNKPID